jgi:hypothetical protein
MFPMFTEWGCDRHGGQHDGQRNGSTVPGFTYAVKSDSVTDVLTKRKSDIIVEQCSDFTTAGQSFALVYYRRLQCFRWN